MSELLPPQRPSPLFSYHAYSVTGRERVHATLLGPSARWTPRTSVPVPPYASTLGQRNAQARAQRRALTGRRPPGVATAADLAELSDEEAALDDDKAAVNQFGHRFLMPFGRRMTLGEMETAPVRFSLGVHGEWGLEGRGSEDEEGGRAAAWDEEERGRGLTGTRC